MSRDFHPDQIAVEPPQPQQVVRDGAFGKEAADERDARSRIHESLGRKGRDGFVGGVRGVSEDRFQMRIDGARVSLRQRVGRQRTDEDTLVHGLEKTRERVRAGSMGNSFAAATTAIIGLGVQLRSARSTCDDPCSLSWRAQACSTRPFEPINPTIGE